MLGHVAAQHAAAAVGVGALDSLRGAGGCKVGGEEPDGTAPVALLRVLGRVERVGVRHAGLRWWGSGFGEWGVGGGFQGSGDGLGPGFTCQATSLATRSSFCPCVSRHARRSCARSSFIGSPTRAVVLERASAPLVAPSAACLHFTRSLLMTFSRCRFRTSRDSSVGCRHVAHSFALSRRIWT